MAGDPVLDIITKPLQFLFGGLRVLAFLLLAAVIAIFTPIYHLLTTGTASAMEIEVALFVIGLIVLFFSAPWFTVLGGTAMLVALFLYFAVHPDGSVPSPELVRGVLWGFQLVGFVWVGVKRRSSNQAVPRTGTMRGGIQTLGLDGIPAPERPVYEEVQFDKAPDWQYRALGLHHGATMTEIKQAYRDLAKVWHPDRFSRNDERLQRKAETKLKEINAAYAYLSSRWQNASVR